MTITMQREDLGIDGVRFTVKVDHVRMGLFKDAVNAEECRRAIASTFQYLNVQEEAVA